jgi:hypothetical protein
LIELGDFQANGIKQINARESRKKNTCFPDIEELVLSVLKRCTSTLTDVARPILHPYT